VSHPQQRILAIDDTPANLLMLGEALANEFHVHIATSGAQGLAQAEETRPDLILLDVMMPEMDGYEVCRRLKAHPVLQHIPVIFVTALGDVDAECKGLGLGAADYLTKPLNVELARLRIRNQLEREWLRKEQIEYSHQLETRVAERTAALSIAKEAAEAASCAKTTFLANMSHELRTPLNQIMGLNILSMRSSRDPKLLGYMQKTQQATERLLLTVNHLLDITHLEANRLTLESVPFSPAASLEALQERFQPEASERQLELHFALAPALSNLLLQGDPMRLQQVFHALIDNAIKFTPAGRVEVRAQLGARGERSVRLLLDVEDSGIGISADDQYRIFDLFMQKDATSTRQYGGAGLGLSICKSLVEHMHGNLKVRSAVGQGSVFSVEVPLPIASETLPTRSSAGHPLEILRGQYAGAAVMLVEVDALMAEVFTLILEEAGLRVVLSDAASLEQQLAGQPCRWILLNADVPGLNMPELIRRLRQLPVADGLPIVMLSDEIYSETIEQSLAAGAQDHVALPIDPVRLYSVLATGIDRPVTD